MLVLIKRNSGGTRHGGRIALGVRSGLLWLAPFPLDPADPTDPLDPVDPAQNSRKLHFEQRCSVFGIFF